MKLFSTPIGFSKQEKAMPIKVAIVDDDDGVRTKLVHAIARFDGCACVGQFSSGEDALARLPSSSPDVVLMDINLPGMNGIECVRQLNLAHPGIEFIMLTVYEDTESVFNALAAGASGYLLKLVPRPELLEAIQRVHAGRRGPEPPKLSPREQEAREHRAKGSLKKKISRALNISYDPVHNHIRHI